MPEAVEGISILFDESVETVEVDTSRLLQLAAGVLEAESVKWSSIGIVLAGHKTVRSLNKEFLDHDLDTDVLSFLLDRTDNGIDAEVYIDVQTAFERFSEFDTTPVLEVARYLVHGLLHLADYADDTPEQKLQMRELENRYLATGW